MDASEKNYVEKRLLKTSCCSQKMKSWLDKDTGQTISAKSLTLLCGGVDIVWSTRTWSWISDATAVTFSVKCFNPLNLNPLLGLLHILFIYLRAFNKYW